MKRTLEVIWHALGAEHVTTSPTNSEELWQTYRKDRFFRWVVPVLAFLIVFTALMAINATIPFALMVAVIVTTGAALVTHNGVLSPGDTALAIEWGCIRKEVRKLRAFNLLVEACIEDGTMLRPQQSAYFLTCQAKIRRLRGLRVIARVTTYNWNYNGRHHDDTTRSTR